LSLENKIKEVLEKIETARKTSPFNQKVDLIAATKTRDISQIQDAEKKFAEFPGFNELKKRFIGHLQTNKVNKCLRLFDTIDSVDSLKLAKKINSSSTEKKIECLIEINTSKEPQKHGFKPTVSEDLISCFTLKNLEIVGLMTIGPYTLEEKKTRNAFKLLRTLKEDINSELGEHKIKELSMGMSGDFEIGVQEGSTMVRVGTGIFGARNY
jgi:pyridoxal phosphate enzyme (YggS family)